MLSSFWRRWLHRPASAPGRRAARCRPAVEPLEERRLPATFTVVNVNDNGGIDPAPGARTGTLRQAIVNANANPGSDTIKFNIGTGQQTIKLLAALPVLTGAVVIDGTTQPGFTGTPLVELDGSSAGPNADGLVVGGGTTAIKGLAVSGFSGNGISLTSSGNAVLGDFVGTDLTGTAALGNGADGVAVFNPGNTIGGTTAGAGNVISGNVKSGIDLVANGNLVEGNRVGTNAAGTAALPNAGDGILVYAGGNTVGAGNVISGNTGNGVDLVGGANLIVGNRIGTDAAGEAALANGGDGVLIFSGQNTVGGTTDAAQNLISANGKSGVELTGTGATGNVIEGNRIGTDAAGTAALGNGVAGVIVFASGNTVGGSAAGAGNLVSGNGDNGVDLDGGGNLVEGNLIGTDVTGTVGLGNGGDGVTVFAAGNTVGGTVAGAGNVIAGNAGHGVALVAGGAVVVGNWIGTDVTGTARLGNGGDGVLAFAGGNTIAGNVIGANGGSGVALFGTDGAGNLVQGNAIGTDPGGTADLGNAHDGVLVVSSNNTVGDSTDAGENVIAFNKGNGINLTGGTGNSVLQNNIFGNGLQGIAQGGPPGGTGSGSGSGSGTTDSGSQMQLSLGQSGGVSVVHVKDAGTGQEMFEFTPFPGWHGRVLAGLMDVNGDGTPDVVVISLGKKRGGQVRIVDGQTGQLLDGPLGSFTAAHGLVGNVSVTVGDFDQDGVPDLFLTARVGSQRVTRVYSGATGGLLATLRPNGRGHRRQRRGGKRR
jgi:titin